MRQVLRVHRCEGSEKFDRRAGKLAARGGSNPAKRWSERLRRRVQGQTVRQA